MPRTHISVATVCSGGATTNADGDVPGTEEVVVNDTDFASQPKEDVPCQSDDQSMSSLEDSDADLCRICHCESERDAPLLAPCVCAGSVRYVHQACLQQWIQSADTRSCELCKYDFHMTTRLKPICEWRWLDMNAIERRKVFCSVLFHAIAITCVIWSLYVLIERTTEEMRSGSLQWQFWTKLVVVAVGFAGGLIFMYVQCRMYVQLCRRWRAYNRVIFVGPFTERSATTQPVVTFQKGEGDGGKHPLPADGQIV